MTSVLAPVISVHGLTKSFGNVHALQGVDLEIGRGETVGLIGDNGAGKSTLIKILSGFDRPSSGEVFLDGQPVRFVSTVEARNAGIETVYQEQALADDVSIARNLFLGKELTRGFGPFRFLDDRRMNTEARRMLDDLRLRAPVSQDARYCSGGERQGVAIARAVYFNAKLVILDEPTNALGVVAVERVLQLVQELRARGIACLFVSHNIDHVFRICDRIIMFVHGRKVLDVPAEQSSVDEVLRMLNDRSGQHLPATDEEPVSVS